MKIYFRSRHGTEFRLESKPHEPLNWDKFCVLAGLSVLAMILVTMLFWEVWR